MAVYLTKSMLLKLNKVHYPQNKVIMNEFGTADHWQKLAIDNENNSQLSKDMICRICAKSGCTHLMEKIDEYDIMSCIRMIANVTITVDDALPKYICTQCLEMLKTAMNFKKLCENADRKFRKILNPLGDPAYHTYPYSKHDFQLILHQMKLKRLKIEEEQEKKRKKHERLVKQKGPKIKQFKCSPCDMVFSNKEKLMAHRRERQCMRRACEVCGQLVVSIAQHMRHIHKQSLPHKCPTCGKEFPIIARLKNHMMVHTNTFNFFCDLCPYKSKHKYYLVMHMRTHTGEKPYKCSQCPATFVNPSNLNKHKLTHQEKQFKCGLCEKAFRTNAALREHHEAAHMNIKHTCQYCGKDFCYKSDLRKHEIRYHNRIKRDYIGGEPTYKQVERLQKMQETGDEMDKWRQPTYKQVERPQKMQETGDEMDKWRQPTYKQVERPQKMQETGDEMDKWRQQTVVVPQVLEKTMHVTPQIVQATYIDPSKDYVQQTLYFSDVSGMMQPQQTHMVPPQTVTLQLPELNLKKDEIEVKLYESQQSIAYF